MSFGHVDLLWLVAGVVLHLCSQLSRGRGWYAIVCAAHPSGDRPRRRDVLLTWVAGAGASGVLSARGGDALRVLLLRRRMTTTCPTLVGTLAAETVAETALGALLTAWALTAGFIPGLHRPTLAGVLLIVSGVLLLLLVVVPRGPPLPVAGARVHRGAPRPRPARQPGPLRAARGVVGRAQPRAADRLAHVPARGVLAAGHADRGARGHGRPQLRPARPVRPRGRRREPRPARRRLPGRHPHAGDRRRGDRVLPRRDRHADRGRHRALRARAGARARLRGRARLRRRQALERLRVPRKAPVRVPAA